MNDSNPGKPSKKGGYAEFKQEAQRSKEGGQRAMRHFKTLIPIILFISFSFLPTAFV
jgi:hypothetical protein